MSYKNTFRPVCPPASRAGGIFEKRLSLLKFLGVFSALVFLPISNVSAQNFTSDYLINTFRNYIVKSEPQPKADQPMAEDILNAFKNYVTPETLVVPITLPKQIIQSAPIILPEPIAPKTLAAAVLTSPTTISIIQSDILNAFKNYVASPQTETNPPRVEILSVVVKPLSTSSPQVTSNPNSINNVALISALQNLFSKKEFADQLRGPIGPQGPTGLKGDSGTSFINSPSQQPAFIGVIQPNPATNFNGATLFGVTNLSSNNFSTSTANITTLSVSGNSTLTGTLNVTGAATIPNLSTTTSITSPLIIGGTDTTSTLTLRPTSGVGTTNADIIFQIGNNGATEAMRILNSGSVGIGTASPAVTAILDLTSTTKGFLGPRMTTTQRDAIVSPTKGLLIYNTTTDTLNVYNGSWGAVGGGSATWGSITGTLSAQTDLQSALDLKATLASPTFTGTVVMPTPFTLGATSVTSTGTQLNYLSSTTGTTGTTNTNVVFSTSPTLVTPVLGVATGTSLALTYGGTTAVTTASGLVLNANSLTIGTGLYAASSTLTSGLLVDLQVSGTAAAASQTALNILTTGANATTAITTYGGQISNTHTNATSGSNVALYLNASGATTANYGLIVNAGRVGIGTTAPLLLLDVAGSQRLTGATTTVLTGSINAIASTTITGVNTLFTTELVVGDRITVTGETRTVVAIASATSLTVDLATTDTANDTAVDKLAAVFIARDANSIPQLVINDEGLASFNSLESGGLNFETDAGAVSWMDMPVSDVPLDDTIQSYTAHLGGNPLLTIYGLADSAGAVDTLRVGIATTIPQSLLDVQGPTGTGATSAGILTLATKELTIVDGDELGRINFNSPLESDGSDSILAGAAIWAEANDTFSTTVNSTELAFGTATTSAAVERMRINSAGNVGIGTTAPSTLLHVGLAGTTLGTIGIAGNTSGLVTLSVAAAAGTWTMKLPAAVGTAGFQLTDAAGDGITSWTGAGSKREYKDILGTMEPKDALSAILSTAVYRFKYKEGFGTGDYTTEYVGILAEEAPWAVHFNGTIINPVNTLGYAVLGIQGLNLKLEGLETRIAILEANGDGIKNEEAIAVFGQYATDFFNSVVKNVVDGVVYMKGLVVDTLKVGSPTKRTGVTLYDEVTGDPYCLSVSNGIQKTTAGGCGIIEPAPIPSLEPTVIDQPPTEKLADEPPVEIPQTDPDPTITPTPDPSIITNPEPTPILEPEPE